MLFSSLSSAIIGVLVAFTSTVAAQDQIPLVCHSGIQVIALPGANVTNGTYGLSATFVNSILGSVANSSSISLNYLRNHTAANARTQFLVEVNDGTIALQQALANYTAACPTTPIVLHGYSEGGVVLANTICGGATPFAISSPAPTTYLNNVIAVIYYGEETRNAGLSYDLGGCETGAPYPNYMDSTATNFVLSQYDIFIKNQTRTAEIPTGVQAIGCYLDSANRTLPVQMWGGKNTNNTAASCSTACAAAGYVYSGTESSSECYCGNTKPADSFIDDGCNSKCSGDNIQYCGGSHRLNVYYNSLITPGATSMVSSTTSTSTTTTSTGTTTTSTTTSTTTTSPTTTSTSTTTTSTSTSTTSTVSATSLPSGIVPYGCFVDSSSRVLPVNVYSNASNTPALCARACRQAGYVYAGTEWHDECWCGNIAPSTVANSSDCSTACDGDATQECGGGYRLSVTKDTSVTVVTPTLPSGVISLGCYADNQSSRTLPYQAYSGPNNNNSACSLLCRAGHYPYSGTEYGKECWCGHSLPSNLMADNSTCNMVCTGDNVEHCGAGLRLSVHQDTTIPTSTQALPSGIVALGCYTDTASYSNARTLPTLLYSNSSNSDSVCALACRDAGYPISGTEYSNECWCGLIAPATSLATTNSSCTMPCPGIGNQICGGSWLLNIQQDTTVRPATPLPSGWTSLGCYEDFSTRTLPVMAWRTSSNSDTSCLNQCQADGYDYAGTENGNECWCGSVAPNSTLVASTSDCDMPCAGDTTQVCGAGFRLSTFQYTAAASAKSRRSGAMGRYSR